MADSTRPEPASSDVAAPPASGRRFGVSPRVFRWFAVVGLVMSIVVVFTGAAVRLTGSGMGCPDWPTCNDGGLVARVGDPGVVKASHGHELIEKGNRTFTAAVTMLASLLLIAGAALRRPFRRDLLWMALLYAFLVLGNGIVGAIVIMTKVQYLSVSLHFVLSMALVMVAVWTVGRSWTADDPADRAHPAVKPAVRRLARLVFVWGAVVVLLGTVVTSAGPHRGDVNAKPLALPLLWVTRVHSAAAILLLVLTCALMYVLRSSPHLRSARLWARATVLVVVVQGAVGYLQYFLRLPEWLVFLHIIGATALWACIVALQLAVPRHASIDKVHLDLTELESVSTVGS